MKRWILWCFLLINLVACGRSEQPNTGSVIDEEYHSSGNLVTVYPTPRIMDPTSTPYIPQTNGAVIDIDMTQVAIRSRFAVTMRQTQTLHLFSSLNAIPSFEWGITFDPATIVATLDGKPLASLEGLTFDEPKNILLRPLGVGSMEVIVYLQYKTCSGCDLIFTKTTYSITVE